MREFCAGPCDRLQSRREGAYVRLELGPKDPPIDKPMTIAIGFRQLSRDRRFATARERFACIRHMLRRPVESLVIDFMVPSGYLRDVIPRYRREHDPFATPDLLNGPPVEEFGAVGYSAEYQPMGRGIPPREPGHAGTISADADVVARAFERMSLDPDDFERYRLSVRYPLPGVWHEMWYRLPERPTHARSRTESPRTGLRGARRAQG
ncbi:MAG: hypothetical protein GC172_12485 [Phycisphaera sp.]|nr:hypothetical protein [Phycisphaera sp.]